MRAKQCECISSGFEASKGECGQTSANASVKGLKRVRANAGKECECMSEGFEASKGECWRMRAKECERMSEGFEASKGECGRMGGKRVRMHQFGV